MNIIAYKVGKPALSPPNPPFIASKKISIH